MDKSIIALSDLPVSRASAKELEQRRYFTGKPCVNGHLAYRLTSSSACAECLKARKRPNENYEAVKAWRLANPEKWAAQSKRYREKYPAKQKTISKRYRDKHGDRLRPLWAAAARVRRRSDPEGNRIRVARFKAKKEQVLAEIAGRPRPLVCDLCDADNGGIVFDHCHESGEFRGWLCDRCNKVLGLIKDSSELLTAMVKYLEKANGKVNGGKKEGSSGLSICGA